MTKLTRSSVIALLCLLTTLSCQKKGEGQDSEGIGRRTEVPIDYNFHCDENFVATWCGENRLDSTISEVCIGNLYFKEESQAAIAFSRGDSGSECYAFSGVSRKTDFPGCALASTNQYVSDLNGSNPFEAVVCYSGEREAYIEGTSFLGEVFKAFYIK